MAFPRKRLVNAHKRVILPKLKAFEKAIHKELLHKQRTVPWRN
jgi:vacuolar-type H+-ATPase subunit D/Vma8